MTTYQYPLNEELQAIERELMPSLTLDDPIFSIMPIVNVDAALLSWEIPNNITGLQGLRGLGGQPGNVTALGGNRYTVRPGVYGEFMTVDEEEMTVRRQYGSFNLPIDVSDLVMDRQTQLLQRRMDRIKYIGWTLVATGTFSVSNANSGVVHTDTFDLQDYNASTWSTASTATPLADFRAMKLLERGHGVSFGGRARAYMNQTTFNYLTANTNAADIGGKRVTGLAQPIGLAATNSVLLDEDLPQIVIYDGGYLDSSGTFTLFLPTNKVIVVGARPGGQSIADYAMTRNANNPNSAPGSYSFVNDRTSGPNKTVPPLIEVHDGHNGGPRIYYPNAIVDMDVS